MTYMEMLVPQAPGTARFVNVLDRLELRMFLGIHPQEIQDRQRVIISVEMLCDYPADAMRDEIEAVLDYDFLRSGITALAETRRFALQESLCEDIARLCWAYVPVQAVCINTSKPDIYGDAAIGCRVIRTRPSSAE